MKPALVDFHCHLDLYPDLESAVKEAEEACVYTLAVTTTPKAWPRNFEISRLTRHVRAGLGLHPQLVAERHTEIALWDTYLPQTRFVGEVGLDAGPQYYRSFDLQKQVFEHVLKQCAKAGGKILSIHSVRAATAAAVTTVATRRRSAASWRLTIVGLRASGFGIRVEWTRGESRIPNPESRISPPWVS